MKVIGVDRLTERGIAGSLRPARWQRYPLRVGCRDEARVVLVTGATGFIGRHLCRHVVASGDQLIVLSRDRRRAEDLYGPHASVCTSLEEIASSIRIDAIVNLAGEPIFAKAWTTPRRRLLIDSRLQVTQALVELIARLHHKPEVLVTASAVGYYGVRGSSGAMLSGMDALNCIWAALPRWRVLAWMLRLPLIRPAAEGVYDFVLAPTIWRWNQRRRASLRTLSTQGEGLPGERIA